MTSILRTVAMALRESPRLFFLLPQPRQAELPGKHEHPVLLIASRLCLRLSDSAWAWWVHPQSIEVENALKALNALLRRQVAFEMRLLDVLDFVKASRAGDDVKFALSYAAHFAAGFLTSSFLFISNESDVFEVERLVDEDRVAAHLNGAMVFVAYGGVITQELPEVRNDLAAS